MHGDKHMETSGDKYVALRPGQPPQIVGSWTLGDFYMLLRWLLELPLVDNRPQDTEVKNG